MPMNSMMLMLVEQRPRVCTLATGSETRTSPRRGSTRSPRRLTSSHSLVSVLFHPRERLRRRRIRVPAVHGQQIRPYRRDVPERGE